MSALRYCCKQKDFAFFQSTKNLIYIVLMLIYQNLQNKILTVSKLLKHFISKDTLTSKIVKAFCNAAYKAPPKEIK